MKIRMMKKIEVSLIINILVEFIWLIIKKNDIFLYDFIHRTIYVSHVDTHGGDAPFRSFNSPAKDVFMIRAGFLV